MRRFVSQPAAVMRPVQRASASAVRSRSGGFALIVVLWVLVLVGFIVLHITATGRSEIRIARNLVANAMADAAAEGAIFETIFNLIDPQAAQRWPVNGAAHELIVGESRV